MQNILFIFLFLLPFFTIAQNSVEWQNYGNDKGGQRYANIDQINRQNVAQLQPAWTFNTQELEKYEKPPWLKRKSAFEATPIMIGGNLYFSSPSNRVFAVNAQTGQQIWEFDPKVDLQHTSFSELTNRGVSYWKGLIKGKEAERIVLATVDGRLYSLDIKTGKPDPIFNGNGFVDLKVGVGRVQVTSAPAIFEDLIITGSSMGDNGRTNMPKGVVRAYDICSGILMWSFDPIPEKPEMVADSAWQANSAKKTGAANAWATISVDEENGLVFIPTSSPSPDFYGGERPGTNELANSIVALNAKDGAYRWHFQVVHHDVWDYDIPCQPVLFDFQDSIPAVAIGTKMGHIFTLDRLTGKPLFPIEERPVPQSNVPGEITSSTQPFPVKPEPIGLHNLTEKDIWGPTEKAREAALQRFAQLRYEGTFTPPSIGHGTLIAPGNVGGMNWSGMSYHPEKNILVTNINNMAYIVGLFPRHDYDLQEKVFGQLESDNNELDPEVTAMDGTPYFMMRDVMVHSEKGKFWGQTRPPWGTLVAIDMKEGNKLWEKPLGFMMNPQEVPQAAEWGSINLGGTLLTAGGLIFVAATFDNFFRAFDVETGKLLWQYELPASGNATPMSYFVNGKQYIVIAAGGHGKMPFAKLGDALMAFALTE